MDKKRGGDTETVDYTRALESFQVAKRGMKYQRNLLPRSYPDNRGGVENAESEERAAFSLVETMRLRALPSRRTKAEYLTGDLHLVERERRKFKHDALIYAN